LGPSIFNEKIDDEGGIGNGYDDKTMETIINKTDCGNNNKDTMTIMMTVMATRENDTWYRCSGLRWHWHEQFGI
jgi:hypothetical protein